MRPVADVAGFRAHVDVVRTLSVPWLSLALWVRSVWAGPQGGDPWNYQASVPPAREKGNFSSLQFQSALEGADGGGQGQTTRAFLSSEFSFLPATSVHAGGHPTRMAFLPSCSLKSQPSFGPLPNPQPEMVFFLCSWLLIVCFFRR